MAGFKVTTNFEKIASSNVIIICVPTPLTDTNKPDLSYIHSALKSIKPFVKDNQLLILESTTYPGTTDEILVPFIEKLNYKIGLTFFIGYSPEREDPGNKKYNTKNIPKIVSGYTKNCLKMTKILYENIIDKVVPVSSTRVAEMTKILENIHRAVNVSLVNELKMVADKMGIDIFEVIKAASTKPFGYTPFYPGPGLGGHCIPIDPFYLTWKARQHGINTDFIELAGKINTEMPFWVIKKLKQTLSEKNLNLKKVKILVLGLAYKKNIDDTRGSPSLKLIDILINCGTFVNYSDPLIPEILATDEYDYSLKSIKLNPGTIAQYDAVILATDHDEFNYQQIKEESKIVIDTRGRFKPSNNIIRA